MELYCSRVVVFGADQSLLIESSFLKIDQKVAD
jgi:hypothetical protein